MQEARSRGNKRNATETITNDEDAALELKKLREAAKKASIYHRTTKKFKRKNRPKLVNCTLHFVNIVGNYIIIQKQKKKNIYFILCVLMQRKCARAIVR